MENFSFQDWFKAFNIITFPPLFFFSALFYTDVASTIIVYLFFQLFLDRLMSKQENQRKEIIQVVLGIGALLFRQTNVFWVAIFPAGLAIIQGTKAIARDRRLPKDGPQSFIEVVQQAWNDSIVYDPPVAEAWLDDYIKAGLSISIVATLNIGKIIPSLYPSLMLLNVFAAFVVWNGGVVLGMLPLYSYSPWRAPYLLPTGDKSNHIATIHTPQMLYIWLYMLFFSWPLTLPTISKILQGFLSPPPFTLILRRLAIFALWTALALAAVHFNTIIHPFTLADNRHYTFYVFKLLRQNPILFYLLTPVYVISAYIIIQTLGAAPSKQPAAETPSLSASAKPSDNAPKPSQPAEALAWLCPSGARTSYILVWTLTTALTLVSAPLVEPRYAILPWLFWRIHVPSISTSALLPESVKKKVESRPPGRMMAGADARMRVEMVWHVAVNVVTAYLFLYQGFSWSGKEWEGQVMRFMW